MPIGENIIAANGLAPFFKISNPGDIDIRPPEIREGDALQSRIRSLSGFQKEAVVASARTGLAWRLVSDEGAYLDGHDAAPCPLAFLSAGMAASYMDEIVALAARQNITIRRVKLTQDNYYTMKGSMQRRTMVGGALPVELLVEIDCDLDDAALNQLVMDAVHASPLNGLMRGQLTSLFALSKNGRELQLGNATPLPGDIYPETDGHFDGLAAEPSELDLVEPVGVTPKKDVALGTAAAGSSLADEQNRVLNIGAVCTLRDDGLKEIVQMQYSPHGTSFRFLSEPAPADGGKGRAPDANTLVSAGFGFCFMTQFGRFVSMLKLDLSEYRIVQDTFFSLGGASGDTGEAGRADPVETHVYLTTMENDDTAREMLDIAERTCFLHAFCRTDLKTKLRVSRV